MSTDPLAEILGAFSLSTASTSNDTNYIPKSTIKTGCGDKDDDHDEATEQLIGISNSSMEKESSMTSASWIGIILAIVIALVLLVWWRRRRRSALKAKKSLKSVSFEVQQVPEAEKDDNGTTEYTAVGVGSRAPIAVPVPRKM